MQINDNYEQKNMCKAPFSAIEIDCKGDVTVCCPAKNGFVIGNIYQTPFDEIWYGEKAIWLRKDAIEKKYSKCNLIICSPVKNILNDKLNVLSEDKDLSVTPPYPKYVKFCHDRHCNIKCITCRDSFITNTKEETDKLNSYIDDIYLPILKNCEIISLNGAGEVFASSHCKTLIKKIVQTYPNIKFDLHTNGVLCTKNACDELGITNKLFSIDISMHAATKKTYEKILLASNWERVRENIKWLSSLKNERNLQRLDLYFVVQKMNYKEMIPFIEYAHSVNANVYFWVYRNWGTKFGKKYNKMAIFEKFHPEYNKLAKILENPIFNEDFVHLDSLLLKIKPISIKEHLKCILLKIS